MKILAISGSTKRGSTSHSILSHISDTHSGEFECEIFDGIEKLPHFDPSVADADLPAEVLDFRKKISASDGVIISTPEYVFSIPGSLKNAIEWCVSSTVFSHKPIAIIVAAASGTKAFESLDLIMTTLETILPDSSKLLIQGAKGKVDSDGNIIDEATKNNIKTLVQSLLESINSKDNTPTKYTQ